MPMGTSWSWVPNEKYKSTDEIIRTLVQVVTRGGSLLLNVAPGPDGQLDSAAYVRLKEVGEWMKVNGEAIRQTRPTFGHKPTTDIGSTSWSEPGCYRNCDASTYYFIDSTGVGDFKVSCGVNATPKAYVLGSKTPLEATPIGNRTLLHVPRSALPGKGPIWVIKLSRRTFCQKEC